MPPKKKQTPRNSFYYFMMEFKGRQGRQYKSMQDVAEAAGPHWARMSKEQRRPYEEKALMEKNCVKPAKYTSEGIDIEEIDRQEKREQMKTQEMKEKINYNLQMAFSGKRIHEEMFFVIHVNTFCYCAAIESFIPAEICIAVFNLEEGVTDIFHKIIKPGPLPIGYAGAAMLHSKETHQIAPPLIGDNENNVEEVYTEMKYFLSNKLRGSKRFPPMYTEEKLIKMTQQVLDNWCEDFNEERPLFEVYNLQYMFRILRNTVANENVWPTDTYSIREIEKDVYSHAKGIACHYHDVTDVPQHCSRSTAVRQCFVICDNCCGDLQIQLRPGQHVPEAAYVKPSRTSSLASISSSQRSSALKPTTRDDDTESVISFSSKSSWDNESVCSDSSSDFTINSEESFPALGGKKKVPMFSSNSWQNFSPQDSSSVVSGHSDGLSYANAMGISAFKKKPEGSVVDDMDKLSIASSAISDDENSPFETVGGRGRGTGAGWNRGFPALRARSRGSIGRGRRPASNDTE